MVPLIVKRDNKLEPFETEKVKRVVRAAGLTEEQAHHLGEQIAGWVHSLDLQHLHSTKLRDRILDEMHKLNKNAANMFAWYQKTKDDKR